MGTASPPPTPPRQPATKTSSGMTPAAGTPPLGPPPPGATSSRFQFQNRPVSMGPSGGAILFTVVALAVGAWLYFKPPGSVGDVVLQKYTGFESNIENISLKDCAPPGCAAVYLTPTIGSKSTEALPGAIALVNELAQQGIESYIVFGQEPIPDAVKRYRVVRRPIVFDPNGDWAKASGIQKAPYWIAWRTGGDVRLRRDDAPTAAAIAAAIR